MTGACCCKLQIAKVADAVSGKPGLCEVAKGGTALQVEIRAVDPVMQAKILTLLDTPRFWRVGSVLSTSVDMRFIAATNDILMGKLKTIHFREDLY